VGKLTAPLFRRRGFADSAVVTDWPAIVGERLAAQTAPERIVFPPRKRSEGTLKLRVGSSGLALELQHFEPQLIERINCYFGFPAVNRIQLLHGPVPPRVVRGGVSVRELTEKEKKELSDALAQIDAPDLAEALENLGACIIGRKRKSR
jgi:hypothetical protein